MRRPRKFLKLHLCCSVSGPSPSLSTAMIVSEDDGLEMLIFPALRHSSQLESDSAERGWQQQTDCAAQPRTPQNSIQSRLSRVVCWQAGNAALRVDRPQLRLIPALLQFLEGLDFLPADGKKLSRRISACFVASSMISLLLILNTSHALHCAGLNRRQQGDKPILLVNSVIYGTSKVILKGSRIGGLQVGSLKVLPYLRLPLPADSWVNRKFANPAALSLHRFIINILHISNAIISELACEFLFISLIVTTYTMQFH